MFKFTLTMGLLLGSLWGAGHVVLAQEPSRSASPPDASRSERAGTVYWAIWYKASANSKEELYRDPANGALATFGNAQSAKDNALYWKKKYGWYSVNWVKYTRGDR